MGAIIYKPSKTATQSGNKQAEKWLLEFERSKTNRDYLMGWFGSDDTSNQVRISFNSKEDAIAFANRNKITFRILEPKKKRLIKRSYADNFRYES